MYELDWILAAKIAGGGYGVCILVLIILALMTWLVGLTRKMRGEEPEDK